MNMDLRLEVQLCDAGGADGGGGGEAGHTVFRECAKRICLTRFLGHDGEERWILRVRGGENSGGGGKREERVRRRRRGTCSRCQ